MIYFRKERGLLFSDRRGLQGKDPGKWWKWCFLRTISRKLLQRMKEITFICTGQWCQPPCSETTGSLVPSPSWGSADTKALLLWQWSWEEVSAAKSPSFPSDTALRHGAMLDSVLLFCLQRQKVFQAGNRGEPHFYILKDNFTREKHNFIFYR